MKQFIVLILLIGVVFGAPQYAYGPPNYHSPGVSSSISHGHGLHVGGGGVSHGIHGGSLGGGFGHGGGIVGGGHHHHHHETLVTKQFFIHSAPEEQDEIGGDKVINLGPGRKHYRVVFIKAPHQNVQGGKVRFVAPANEEKTVIYVLSKKTDLADIAADVQQAHSEPTKPEVHFIKYKTAEEAAHAQRTIQAQYDSIQGTSQVLDEGIAPVQSVIGALGDSSSNVIDNSGIGGGGISHISQGSDIGDNGAATYLPPATV